MLHPQGVTLCPQPRNTSRGGPSRRFPDRWPAQQIPMLSGLEGVQAQRVRDLLSVWVNKKKGTEIRLGPCKATQNQSKRVSGSELQEGPLSHVSTIFLCSPLAGLNGGGVVARWSCPAAALPSVASGDKRPTQPSPAPSGTLSSSCRSRPAVFDRTGSWGRAGGRTPPHPPRNSLTRGLRTLVATGQEGRGGEGRERVGRGERAGAGAQPDPPPNTEPPVTPAQASVAPGGSLLSQNCTRGRGS